nr:cytochrome c3 family protein [Geotalea sp. SG265]
MIVRVVAVPRDFGIHDRGYMYGWYRLGNEKEWKNIRVKYKTNEYCKECHREKYTELLSSPHGRIMCEDCHGPALGHPEDPPTLTINRERKLCLRCHSRLPYKSSIRGNIRGIDPDTHNPGAECVLCHYPHNPLKEAQHDHAAKVL